LSRAGSVRSLGVVERERTGRGKRQATFAQAAFA
jgi:hypothetical protein